MLCVFLELLGGLMGSQNCGCLTNDDLFKELISTYENDVVFQEIFSSYKQLDERRKEFLRSYAAYLITEKGTNG
jgi:hypothetical protein